MKVCHASITIIKDHSLGDTKSRWLFGTKLKVHKLLQNIDKVQVAE